MDSYDLIDRFLRNSLDDDDYAAYSCALDAVYAGQQDDALTAEREVSDKLEKALTAMVQANGGVNVMPGQQAREQNSALNNSRAALTEVAAIRATHTNREQAD
ncbi:MAG: hypothetical protein WC710_15250 [Gallionella sp.]|jgi:hypothetical protein